MDEAYISSGWLMAREKADLKIKLQLFNLKHVIEEVIHEQNIASFFKI